MAVKDCVVLAPARPSARVVARVDPDAAARMAERLASRPAAGSGASVGVARRIPTALIVCAALGAVGVSVPPLLAAVQPRQAVVATTENLGVRHVATLWGGEMDVAGPGGLIFVPAVLGLAWLRRGSRHRGLRNAGAAAPHTGRRVPADGETSCRMARLRCPFLDVSSLKLAGRGFLGRAAGTIRSSRAPGLFGRGRA